MAISNMNAIEINNGAPLERTKLAAQSGPATSVRNAVSGSAQGLKDRPTTSLPLEGVLVPGNTLDESI